MINSTKKDWTVSNLNNDNASQIFKTTKINILYLDNLYRLLLQFQHRKRTIKDYTCPTNGLPDDEHKIFETCRRHQELNWNINLKSVHLVGLHYISVTNNCDLGCRVQLKSDGTRWRTGGEVKGKLANAVGSQYPSHYLGTWCIQHYYRWCAHLGCQ